MGARCIWAWTTSSTRSDFRRATTPVWTWVRRCTWVARPTVASWRGHSTRGCATSIAAACGTCDWTAATSWSFSGCWWNSECPASAPVVRRCPTSVRRRRATMEEAVSIAGEVTCATVREPTTRELDVREVRRLQYCTVHYKKTELYIHVYSPTLVAENGRICTLHIKHDTQLNIGFA